jgi:PAS domain S-box-containing protein
MERTNTIQSKAALWLCALAGVLGLLGVLGNLGAIDWLTIVIPGRPRMQFSTAVALALAAAGVALQQQGVPATRFRRVASRLAGAALALFAVVMLVEYTSGVDFGVDEFLVSGRWLGLHAQRPSPFTAAALASLGGALLLFDLEQRLAPLAREGLCLTTSFIAFTTLVGHLFGVGALYRFGDSTVIGTALPTAVALSALGIGAWFARPDRGLLRVASAPGPGGILLRRLGLSAVLGAPLIGGLFLLVVNAIEIHDLSLSFAIGTVLCVVFALGLLATTAYTLERTAEAAHANWLRGQALFEHAPQGIFIADLTGRYTEVNTAGCRLIGLSRDEVLASSITDLIPPEDAERLALAREQVVGGAVQIANWKLRRKDGTYAQVEVTTKLLPDRRWLAFVRDISERVELERKLLESRNFLQSVLESSTEYAIVAADPAQRVVLWNEGARRTYGYGIDEIRGQQSAVLVARGQEDAWAALQARALEQGKAEAKIAARRRDGSTFAAHVVCTRRVGAGLSPPGVLIVTRDLTEEQRALTEQEFLSRVGVELAACLEYRQTLETVIRLARDFLGDLVTIDIVEAERERRLALERTANQATALAVARLGPVRPVGHPLRTVTETKQPLLLAEITREDRERFAASPEHARVLDAVGATSAMIVPLLARGQLLAVLSISARGGSRVYTEADLRIAMELARRAALTLDNVQLFQQSRMQGAMTRNLSQAVLLVRAGDFKIVYANPRAETMFGFSARELLGLRITDLHARGDELDVSLPPANTNRAGDERECVRADGTRFVCSVSTSNFDHEEHGPAWIALYTDITERKRLEQRTARALHEKEILLREIHHRVKNNLQVISSLFSLQCERTQSEELKSLLDESRTRVESIALVHEQLYRSTDLAAIDFDAYLSSLVQAIRSTYGAERIAIEVCARDVLLDIEQAVPCALLVCELVSNSFKHAFPKTSGKVWVRAERDAQGFCILEVGDDGRGMPADLDWTKCRSLGLRLVRGLARQLRATIALDSSKGIRFKLRFAPFRPIASPAERELTAIAAPRA